METNEEDKAKEEPMDTTISWIVLIFAFIGQAMSIGFYYAYGILYAEIRSVYGATERSAGYFNLF